MTRKLAKKQTAFKLSNNLTSSQLKLSHKRKSLRMKPTLKNSGQLGGGKDKKSVYLGYGVAAAVGRRFMGSRQPSGIGRENLEITPTEICSIILTGTNSNLLTEIPKDFMGKYVNIIYNQDDHGTEVDICEKYYVFIFRGTLIFVDKLAYSKNKPKELARIRSGTESNYIHKIDCDKREFECYYLGFLNEYDLQIPIIYKAEILTRGGDPVFTLDKHKPHSFLNENFEDTQNYDANIKLFIDYSINTLDTQKEATTIDGHNIFTVTEKKKITDAHNLLAPAPATPRAAPPRPPPPAVPAAAPAVTRQRPVRPPPAAVALAPALAPAQLTIANIGQLTANVQALHGIVNGLGAPLAGLQHQIGIVVATTNADLLAAQGVQTAFKAHVGPIAAAILGDHGYTNAVAAAAAPGPAPAILNAATAFTTAYSANGANFPAPNPGYQQLVTNCINGITAINNAANNNPAPQAAKIIIAGVQAVDGLVNTIQAVDTSATAVQARCTAANQPGAPLVAGAQPTGLIAWQATADNDLQALLAELGAAAPAAAAAQAPAPVLAIGQGRTIFNVIQDYTNISNSQELVHIRQLIADVAAEEAKAAQNTAYALAKTDLGIP